MWPPHACMDMQHHLGKTQHVFSKQGSSTEQRADLSAWLRHDVHCAAAFPDVFCPGISVTNESSMSDSVHKTSSKALPRRTGHSNILMLWTMRWQTIHSKMSLHHPSVCSHFTGTLSSTGTTKTIQCDSWLVQVSLVRA